MWYVKLGRDVSKVRLPCLTTGGFVQASNAKNPLPGVPLVQPSLVPANKNNFAPRVGFAWQPLSNSNRLVMRGGYGIYYDRANSRLLNNQILDFPYYTLAQAFLTPIANPFVQVPQPSAYPLAFNNPALFPFGGPPALLPRAPSIHWESLVRGVECPLYAPRAHSNEYQDFVAALSVSSLYLAKNQTYRGQCVLIFDLRHAARPDQLSASEWQAFCGDLFEAQGAVTRTVQPDHVNAESLGNVIPIYIGILCRAIGAIQIQETTAAAWSLTSRPKLGIRVICENSRRRESHVSSAVDDLWALDTFRSVTRVHHQL